MFTDNTAFILGAGASTHYHYPTGEELVRRLIEKAANVLSALQQAIKNGVNDVIAEISSIRIPVWLRQTYTTLSEAASDMKIFLDRLSHINPLVADYFLGQNHDLKLTGKVLIAAVILDCDARNQRNQSNSYKEDWYKFILHELVNGCRDCDDLTGKNKVKFITFNYDVSIERHLYSRLSAMNIFKHCEGRIRAFLEDSIIHFYGSVGDKFCEDDELSNDNFASEAHDLSAMAPLLDKAFMAQNGIRIIDPALKSPFHDREQDIFSTIQNAKNIYILGYGFDPHNNNHVGLTRYLHPLKKKNVFFTNYQDSNRINKLASKLLFDNYDDFLSYERPVKSDRALDYWCEKSTQNVYEALRSDFQFFNNAKHVA